MFLPIAMTLSVIVSLIFTIILFKWGDKEEDPMLQFFIFGGGMTFLFLAGGAMLGIIAKTFELWGNSW